VKASDYGLLILVFALRFAAIALPGNLLQTDPDGYLRLANGLVESGVYGLIDEAGRPHATAFRPPLYPVLLAATIWCTGSASLWAIASLHAGLATLSAALLLSIGRSLNLRFATAACLLFSIDPLLIRQSQLIMTETVATSVGLFSWWLMIYQERLRDPNQPSTLSPLTKWTFTLLIGISFGIATLTRPTAIVWLALIVAYFVFRSTTQRTVLLRQAAWLCAGCAIVLIPWIARNREHFGKSIWATTHGGYTLLLANNSILYDHFATGSVSRDWDEDRFHREWAKQKAEAAQKPDYIQRHREVVDDEFAQSVALDTIRQRPLMFAWSAVDQVANHCLVYLALCVSFDWSVGIGTQKLGTDMVAWLAAADQPHISTLRVLEQYADASPCPASRVPTGVLWCSVAHDSCPRHASDTVTALAPLRLRKNGKILAPVKLGKRVGTICHCQELKPLLYSWASVIF
jgi:4-amino-4-deoxy-L-arabinose transferase-like glycosyltransferase